MCGVVVTTLLLQAERPGFKPWTVRVLKQLWAAFTMTSVTSSRIRTLNRGSLGSPINWAIACWVNPLTQE